MLKQILLFEVRYQLRQPLFWIAAAVFALLTFGAVVSDNVTVGGAIGNVHRNAPSVIIQLMTVMSVIGVFVITAFVAGAIHRDFDRNTAELIFSKPVRKRDYLLGRFGGSVLVSFGVLAAPALGILVGSFMPWLDPERLGPFRAAPYLWTLGVMVLPNLIFIGAVFFTVAGLTRSMLSTYLAVVGFFVVYSLSGVMLGHLENETLASLLDPFGLATIGVVTRYWTIVERNAALPELRGVLLANRLVWMALGLAVFAAGSAAFGFTSRLARRWRRPRPAHGPESASTGAVALPAATGPAAPLAAAAALPAAARTFGRAAAFRQYLRQTRLEVVGVFKSVPFIVILAFGVFNILGSAGFTQHRWGTPVWPVTHLMLTTIANSFAFLLLIIVTFYAGELVWRERSLRLAEVTDALPTPTWIPFAAKLTALELVVVACFAVGALTTMGYQVHRGYHHFEPAVYLKGLVVLGYPFLLTCVLAVFLQTVSKNKFLGYLLMILYMISTVVLHMLDLDHNLYQFAGFAGVPYSDMNGYGHFVKPLVWFGLYWTLFTGMLALLTVLGWQRGTGATWPERLRVARLRFRAPLRRALLLCFLAFVATGAYIYYNTNILNEYVPGDLARRRQADYEKRYRRYNDVLQPRVTAVSCNVDIYPRERRVEIRGRYTLRNKTAQPIDTLHVDIRPRAAVDVLRFRPHTTVLDDTELGYHIYALDEPLAPGDSMAFAFELTVANPGFVNNGSNTSVVENGTFFNNQQYFPTFGYDEGRQLVDRNQRRKQGLEPVRRMAPPDDLFARRNNYVSTDGDWIDFETTVSTDPEQIAIAPGYLQKEWTEGGRRYFHYAMDAPILNFYAFLSARYQVRRDHWHDVAIEIYYHRGHEYNIDRMIEAIKAALDYYTENFSPYQHRQVRIIEFPGYASFAQSFPNTIPYSESVGFIANLQDEDAVDYVYYVTAHEVAHQWWAHQLIGGNVQGSTMLSETMAQYSALMVMEKTYGKEKMRRFLKYELDRYLRGRSGELVEEMPLLRVEQQPYIHYNKGSVVMYALRDYIGEASLNRALTATIDAFAFQEPPWTCSLECYDFLRAATPDSLRSVLTDMFETITLFENRCTAASYTEVPGGGRYRVHLELAARKLRAGGQGVETEVPIDDWIDVGVFGDGDAVLYLQKHHITEHQVTLEVTVDGEPLEAGIDPYNKLIDRSSDDNRKKVSHAGALAARGR